ncbi:unnamed protein product [Didymodactylos carnosus]|nr:unnamed protein product [Didymodactylos carnosus]CAF3906788.1 unnamed protein product [Didymodactylos carnosus]
MSINDSTIVKDVALTELSLENNIFSLIQIIHPQWSKFNTVFKRFDKGLNNSVIAVFEIDTNTNEIINESEGLLIKIYGHDTDLFIDRQNELNIMKKISNHGFSNNILLQFSNGYICSYIPGEACNSKQVLSEHISFLIAKKLAHYHSLPLPNEKLGTCLISRMKKFFSAIKVKDQLHTNLSADIEHIETFIMPRFELDIVLCHNDLVADNIIYNVEKDDVSFIDFEYGFYNYWLYDIADHFTQCDDLYPSREYQKQWLSVYLLYKTKHSRDEQFDLDTLCNLITKFSALSNLFWTLWAYAKAHLMNNDHFSYEENGKMRYNKYLELKPFLFVQ